MVELWERERALGEEVWVFGLYPDKSVHVELANKRGELCVVEKVGKHLGRKSVSVGDYKRSPVLRPLHILVGGSG